MTERLGVTYASSRAVAATALGPNDTGAIPVMRALLAAACECGRALWRPLIIPDQNNDWDSGPAIPLWEPPQTRDSIGSPRGVCMPHNLRASLFPYEACGHGRRKRHG